MFYILVASAVYNMTRTRNPDHQTYDNILNMYSRPYNIM